MKKTICIVLMLITSKAIFSQAWTNANPTYCSGDATIGGVLKVGSYLKVTNNQLCVEDLGTDLYLNNAAAGNGNVWLGKPSTGLVTVMNNLYTSNNIIAGNFMMVGAYLKITNNQICVEDPSTPLYINGAAAGNGNVVMGKTGTGVVSVMNEFNVNNNGTINFKVKNTGSVYAREIKVMVGAFPDYVFEKKYDLKTIEQLKQYVFANKRLPNMPSAAQVKEDGANLGEIQRVTVEKVEELYLYMFQLKEQVDSLKKENSELKLLINSNKH